MMNLQVIDMVHTKVEVEAHRILEVGEEEVAAEFLMAGT